MSRRNGIKPHGTGMSFCVIHKVGGGGLSEVNIIIYIIFVIITIIILSVLTVFYCTHLSCIQ
jgi:hypothetical protein